jgi:cell wall-associated NlpC family hydrolase
VPATCRRQRLLSLPVLLALALTATLFLAGPAEATTRRNQRIIDTVAVARAHRGDPYVYGAAGPNAFDCSGLTMFIYAREGFSIPRTAADQYAHMRHIPKPDVRRGDLIFFHDGNGVVYHASVFAGWKNHHRYIWHASRPGTGVSRVPIWTGRWYAATLRR